MANAPVAPPAPAAPADAGTTPAAPRTLQEIKSGMNAIRGRPVQAPQGGFVKMPPRAAPVAPKLDAPAPTTAAKAGLPADLAKAPAPEPEAEAPAAPQAEVIADPPKPDAHAELKKAFDAKSRQLAEVTKQMMEYENLGKNDFQALVRKLAEHYKADPQAIAEKLLLERATKWQEEQDLAAMEPDARELHQLRKERDARAAADAKAAEAAKAKAADDLGRHTYESTTSKLIDAHKLLPESIRNNPAFNGRAALRLKDAMLQRALAVDPAMPADEFLASIDPAALAKDAWDGYRAELREAALALDDAGLDELFDEKLQERFTGKLRGKAVAKAHPSLTAQPRTASGQFTAGSAAPVTKADPKPLGQMKPAWNNFIPKKR